MATLWVGDFRGKQLQHWLSTNALLSAESYAFFVDDHADISWLNTTATSEIAANAYSGTNVIIMTGLMDCIYVNTWNINTIDQVAASYVTSINNLIDQFTSVNFFMCSVSYVEDDCLSAAGDGCLIQKNILNATIDSFNNIIKNHCNATYIDCNSYLNSTYFSTRDGIRFTQDTCMSLLSYILSHTRIGTTTSYLPRLTVPKYGSDADEDGDGIAEGDYWLSTANGGLNPFPKPGVYAKGAGDTLPNCTAYAWGRFYEIIGEKPKLSTGNAEQWYEKLSDGYERGQTPQLGAVICWQKGSSTDPAANDGAGHVAIVEQINSDGSIVTSESGWQTSSYWWLTKRSKGSNGNWGQSSAYKFQGFIYNPAIKNGTVADHVEKSQVTSGNFWIKHKSDEMKLNARYIWQYFGSKGWTLNAVAGLLGNLQAESRINPGIWQSLREWGSTSHHGYGLVQWTPYTKYTNWCKEQVLSTDNKYGIVGSAEDNYGIADMDNALKRIEWEIDHKKQWYSTKEFPLSFKEFTTSTKDPYWLGCAFLINYERPKNQGQSVRDYRGGNAKYWYNYLLPFAPEANPALTLNNIKISDLSATKIKVSFISRGVLKAVYYLKNSNDKIIDSITVDVDNQATESASDVRVLFAQFDGLVPNKAYKLDIEVTDNSETLKDTISFSTLQSFPESMSNITLEINDNLLPHCNFKLVALPEKPDFGYWKHKSHGYAIQLIINGELKQEKFIPSLPATFDVKDLFEYAPKIGDTIQIGIRTWVAYDGKKLYDNNFVKVSNAICMLKKSTISYLNIN